MELWKVLHAPDDVTSNFSYRWLSTSRLAICILKTLNATCMETTLNSIQLACEGQRTRTRSINSRTLATHTAKTLILKQQWTRPSRLASSPPQRLYYTDPSLLQRDALVLCVPKRQVHVLQALCRSTLEQVIDGDVDHRPLPARVHSESSNLHSVLSSNILDHG